MPPRPRFTTVRHPRLSLWQSAVHQVARPDVAARLQASGGTAAPAAEPGMHHVLEHPMVQGASLHAHRHERGKGVPQPGALAKDAKVDQAVAEQAHLSHLHYEMAEGRRTGNWLRWAWAWLRAFLGSRRYSPGALLGWASCVTTYLRYYDLGLKEPNYRDWKTDGGGDIDYSVVRAKLPANARIGIVGDWGTGMPDAVDMLRYLVAEHEVNVVVHLGDVYYAGTPEEARRHVDDAVAQVRQETGRPFPFLQIPGNHDYYANNTGFLNTVDGINRKIGGEDDPWRQRASYFCVRTEDDAWQLLGMDTGLEDRHPLKANSHPALRPSEVEWHRDKLRRFPGKTLLFSHHQLFSANLPIAPDAVKGKKTPANVNPNLLDAFGQLLGKVPAWFWGHEHNQALFAKVEGVPLERGRLLGSSSFEMYTLSDPYEVNYPGVPYREGMGRLDQEDGYYNHGYAVIDLADTRPPEAGDSVEPRPTVRYYQFPSWGHSIYGCPEEDRRRWHAENGQIDFEELEPARAGAAR